MSKPSHRRKPQLATTSTTLVNRVTTEQPPAVATAELVVAGLASNAIATQEWSKFPFRELDLTTCLNALDLTTCLNAIVDSAERVWRLRGDESSSRYASLEYELE